MKSQRDELPPEVLNPNQVLPKDRPERCSKCKCPAFTGPKYVSFEDQTYYYVKGLQWDGLKWTCRDCGHTVLTACKDSKLWEQIKEKK